jgi:hypothetical protein
MKKLYGIALALLIASTQKIFTKTTATVKGTIANPTTMPMPLLQRPIENEESSTDFYISFSLMKERKDKEQGMYNTMNKTALTPDGRLFYNVIIQKNNKQTPTESHILLGYYEKPGRGKIPSGVPTFAPVQAVMDKFYIFGVRLTSLEDVSKILTNSVSDTDVSPLAPSDQKQPNKPEPGRPEPRPMAMPFEINTLLLQDGSTNTQGTYIPAKAEARLPDGRRFTDVIAQKESKLAADADAYTLLGTYQKEELYQKPKGGGMSIGLHSSQVTYYLFGKQA